MGTESLAPVERLAALAADRLEILGVARPAQPRSELGEALFQPGVPWIAIEPGEALAQLVGIATLDLRKRDIASQLLLLALHRLELPGDRHELLRLGAERPGERGKEQHGEGKPRHATFILAFGSGYG